MKAQDGLLILVSVALSLAILELGLRLITPFPIHDPESNLIAHEALGYVLAPDFAGADDSGFRNASALEAAEKFEIIAIGDSHTFGFGVAETDAWPYFLGEMTGAPTYNFGFGGYGILQYRYLFDEALKRGASTIVVGLYLMNDLADYCDFAASNYWSPKLDAAGLDYTVCGRPIRNLGAGRYEDTPVSLLKSTATGSLLAFLRSQFFYSLGRTGVEVVAGSMRTWTNTDRIEAVWQQMNTARPRIAEGRRAAFHYLAEMAALADAADVRFGVVLIPTRERVLLPYLDAEAEGAAEWQRAVAAEEDLVSQFGNYFATEGIAFIDSLPYVAEAVTKGAEEGIAIYPIADGHPLAAGQYAYAEAARDLLGRPSSRTASVPSAPGAP